MGPPNVLGLPNPASSMRTSSTLGAPSGGVGCPIRFQSGWEPLRVLLVTPAKAGRRIGRLLRSGSLIVLVSLLLGASGAPESVRHITPYLSDRGAGNTASPYPSGMSALSLVAVAPSRESEGARSD